MYCPVKMEDNDCNYHNACWEERNVRIRNHLCVFCKKDLGSVGGVTNCQRCGSMSNTPYKNYPGPT